MHMGVTWFYRALRKRIATKDKRGWNRTFVEQLRNVAKQSLKNRYPNKMPRGIELVDKAIDSIMVLADDDSVYFYILGDVIRDAMAAKLEVPPKDYNDYSEELKKKLYKKNKDIIVKHR